MSVGVGSAFAFALGTKQKNHENYQTYLTDDGTLMTINGSIDQNQSH